MQTFSQVLQAYVDTSKLKPAQVLRRLQQNEVKISKPAFYRYLSGENVPKLSKATSIAVCLGIKISSDEMAKVIDYSEAVYESKQQDLNILSISMKVDYKRIIKSNDAKKIIEDRISLTSRNMTDYIVKLMKKDLSVGILEEGVYYGIKKILWTQE